jgi:RNA polymerase sigma-70 factor (ECF subfamily)
MVVDEARMATDRQLVERIRAADSAAFDALFERHAEAIRRRLMRVVRDPIAAEDLLQEVFLRLWTRAEQYSGSGPVGGWLMRTATNLALNHLRSSKRRRTRPLQGPCHAADESADATVPGWMIDAAAPSPDELVEQAEQHQLLHDLVDSLPEAKRRTIRLVHDDQLDIAAAAEALGVSPGTVKSRLHYARQELLREWRALNDEWEDGT